MNFSFDNYNTEGFFDEMFFADGQTRSGYTFFKDRVETLSKEEFMRRQISAERALMAMGITFNVYSENEGTERIMPVDIIPRIVNAQEWEKNGKGLNSANYCLKFVFGRHLFRSKNHQRWHHSQRGYLFIEKLFSTMHGH